MIDLNTTKIGTFTKDSDTSTPVQITAYVDSIVSADYVAFGKYSKAINNGIAIGLSALLSSQGNSIAIGNCASADNYGVAVGHQACSIYGTALGADATAFENTSVALGRYSRVSAEFATLINGNESKTIVNEDYGTLKFYNGTDNITIVNASGQISANVAASCTGNAATATALKTTHKIGGQNFNGSQDVVLSATLTEADAGTATDKLITPYATARAVKNALIHNANGTAGGTAIEGDATKAQVQSWLGTNQLTFVFNDSTTRTFNFVCNEVVAV